MGIPSAGEIRSCTPLYYYIDTLCQAAFVLGQGMRRPSLGSIRFNGSAIQRCSSVNRNSKCAPIHQPSALNAAPSRRTSNRSAVTRFSFNTSFSTRCQLPSLGVIPSPSLAEGRARERRFQNSVFVPFVSFCKGFPFRDPAFLKGSWN